MGIWPCVVVLALFVNVGMCGWAFILFEIFAGESSKASSSCSAAVQKSFANMGLIVSLGWCIYPLGYFLGFLTGIADQTTLNVVYNIADLVNKICFVLSCWACAKEDTERLAKQYGNRSVGGAPACFG